ncbi:hypothetical protein ACFOD4_08600 [Pseudoroseomonas globiformis]|uniref:DUF1018 domain-containing protein n=1 Tax=Teichococcus globiformis TaxID=2307229 RepID=A0ABV7FXL5_9PROT
MSRGATEQELSSIRIVLSASMPIGTSPETSAQHVLRLIGIKADELDEAAMERMTRSAMPELELVQERTYPNTAAMNAWIDRWILAAPHGDGLLDDRLLRKALAFLLAQHRKFERHSKRKAKRYKVVQVELDLQHAGNLAVIVVGRRFKTDQEAIRALIKEAASRISSAELDRAEEELRQARSANGG